MQIFATLEKRDGKRIVELKDRQGWTLFQLAKAGNTGLTALHNPALHLAAYVHSLRNRGFFIETVMEEHSGTYGGRHARYKLTCDIEIAFPASEGQT